MCAIKKNPPYKYCSSSFCIVISLFFFSSCNKNHSEKNLNTIVLLFCQCYITLWNRLLTNPIWLHHAFYICTWWLGMLILLPACMVEEMCIHLQHDAAVHKIVFIEKKSEVFIYKRWNNKYSHHIGFICMQITIESVDMWRDHMHV